MIYFLLAFLLFTSPLSAQVFPPMTLTSPEIPGNNVDEDGDGTYDEAPTTSIVEDANVADQYHWHFKDCDKTIWANVADDTFPDDFRVEKPTGSQLQEGTLVCYIPNLPAGTYALHIFYSTPTGTRAIWPVVGAKNLNHRLKAEEASILTFVPTPTWQQLIYTGTATNYYAGANGGDTVSFVHAGGAFTLQFKADDVRLACGYLATTATPTLTCPDEAGGEAPVANYVMLEKGAETTPTAFNSAAFTHANVMSFTGTEVGTVCGGTLTVKGLWDDAATDRQYWSIVCADTDDETTITTDDNTSMPSANQDQVDIRWRGDQSALLDTNAYMVIANLHPVFFDADWSGTANARNPAVNLNTTVVRNITAATSWNIFIAADLGSNIAGGTVGIFNLAVQDKDAGVSGTFKNFHGTGVTDPAQWGTIQWSATTVPASGGGGDVTAPIVTAPAIPAGSVEDTSFIVTAATDEAGTCRVRYGLTDGSHTFTSAGVPSVNGICTVAVTGLTAGTEYFADVQVTDASNNPGDSTEVSATTDAAVTNCTKFASASGTGDGSAVGKPYKIADFWGNGHAVPGAVLCLASGTYKGADSVINPPDNLNGNALAPITIKASTDGGPWLHGEGLRRPVELINNDFWILEGFDASNSPISVVTIGGGASNNIIRRVCAWDSSATSNNRVWAFTGDQTSGLLHNNLIEDSCGFGVSRRIFASDAGGGGSILRRFWGAFTSTSIGGPESTIQCCYQSQKNTFENVVLTWKQTTSADSTQGEASIVHFANEGADHKWLGSMLYVRSGDLMDPTRIFRTDFGSTTAHGPIEIRDVIIYAAEQPTKQPWQLTTGLSCVGCTITNTTEIGGAASSISAAWTQTNRGDYASLAAMTTASANPFQATSGNGGRMCFRYVDRVLTSTKLWPWPMDDRILAALTRAGKDPDDYFGTGNTLTEYLESVFGTIPPGCKA